MKYIFQLLIFFICVSLTETTSRIFYSTTEVAFSSFQNDNEEKAYKGCYTSESEENVYGSLKIGFEDGFSKCDYCFDDFCNGKEIGLKDTDFYWYSYNFTFHGEACMVP